MPTYIRRFLTADVSRSTSDKTSFSAGKSSVNLRGLRGKFVGDQLNQTAGPTIHRQPTTRRYRNVITTYSAGAVLFCSLASDVVCRLSSSVTLHGRPAGGFTRACHAMTSCRLQSNYSSTVTLRVGLVVLHPVRATPCYLF